MSTIVIYHKSDFDGIFCREIARKFLTGATLIGWDYGDPEPVVSPEDTLYMLDLSVPGLMTHPNLVWIDHHKSAIENYQPSILGYRIDGVAACRMAWQWFSTWNNNRNSLAFNFATLPTKQDFIDRKVSEPWAVRLAGEYDIWDKRNPDAELFQHGLKSQELGGFDWESLLDGGRPHSLLVGELLKQGIAVQYAKTQENESIIKNAGFTLVWEGKVWLACNHARYNSALFTTALYPHHEGCLGFAWRGGKWTVSLYHAPGKEYFDLSEIAMLHGGGGHKGACGFTCKELPFKLS